MESGTTRQNQGEKHSKQEKKKKKNKQAQMPCDGWFNGQKVQCDWSTENEDRLEGDEVRDRHKPDHLRPVGHCKEFKFYAKGFIKKSEMIYALER